MERPTEEHMAEFTEWIQSLDDNEQKMLFDMLQAAQDFGKAVAQREQLIQICLN